ncbi:MAG: hypothetical protein ACI4CS_04830 [Candidatus Weimeria sp.]
MKAKQVKALVAALTAATTVAGVAVPVFATETTPASITADKNLAISSKTFTEGDTITVKGHEDAVATVKGVAGNVKVDNNGTGTPTTKENVTIADNVQAGTYTLSKDCKTWTNTADSDITYPMDSKDGIAYDNAGYTYGGDKVTVTVTPAKAGTVTDVESKNGLTASDFTVDATVENGTYTYTDGKWVKNSEEKTDEKSADADEKGADAVTPSAITVDTKDSDTAGSVTTGSAVTVTGAAITVNSDKASQLAEGDKIVISGKTAETKEVTDFVSNYPEVSDFTADDVVLPKDGLPDGTYHVTGDATDSSTWKWVDKDGKPVDITPKDGKIANNGAQITVSGHVTAVKGHDAVAGEVTVTKSAKSLKADDFTVSDYVDNGSYTYTDGRWVNDATKRATDGITLKKTTQDTGSGTNSASDVIVIPSGDTSNNSGSTTTPSDSNTADESVNKTGLDAVAGTLTDGVYKDASGKTLSNAAVLTDDGVVLTDENGAAIPENTKVTFEDKTYLINDSGVVASSEKVKVNGKTYVAKKNGTIAKKAFVTLAATGSRVYTNRLGSIVKNKAFTVKGVKYLAKKSGALVKSGKVTQNGKTYTVKNYKVVKVVKAKKAAKKSK